MQSKLLKHTVIYTLGQGLSKISPLILLPILTRYLSVDSYGELGLLMTINIMLAYIIGLSSDTAIGIDFYKTGPEHMQKVVSSVLVISLFGLAISLVLIPLIAYALQINAALLWMVMLIGFFQYLFSIFSNILVLKQKPVFYVSLQIIFSFFILGLNLLFVVWLKQGLSGKITADLLVNLLFGALSLFLIWKANLLTKSIHFKTFMETLKIGLVSFPHRLSGWLVSAFDRFVLNFWYGKVAVAFFTVPWQIATIFLLMAFSFNQAWTPFCYKHFSQNEFDLVKKQGRRFALLFAVLALAFIVIASCLFRFLVNPLYHESLSLIGFFVIGIYLQILYYLVLPKFFYYKKLKLLSWMNGLCALMRVILSIMLIKFFYIKGAAIGFAISWFITWLVFLLAGSLTFKREKYA